MAKEKEKTDEWMKSVAADTLVITREKEPTTRSNNKQLKKLK